MARINLLSIIRLSSFILLNLTWLSLSSSVWGQTSPAEIFFPSETNGWQKINPAFSLPSSVFISQYAASLGVAPEDHLEWYKTDFDEMGYAHHRFQLIHQEIKVEHARVYTHERNNRVEKVNYFLPQISTPTFSGSSITEESAISLAVSHLEATQYIWELGQEFYSQFYPNPELLWTDVDFDWSTHDYRPAWKMEISTSIPHGSWLIYVDAENGEILKKLNTLQTIDKPGTAHTKYHGTRDIVADSFENGYRLREYSRAAGGIETLDLNNGTDLASAVDFTDDDNDWNNITPQWDEHATDVHWGLEMAYDYYYQTFGRDSYDGNGGKMVAYVHFDDPASQSAFWNVTYAGFGDNNGSPHVSIDVVGHEVVHGIIRNSAGNLIYIDEGGALNEGYADILGKALEYHVDSANFSWILGQRTNNLTRSLANPNSFGDPDTYGGTYWFTGDGDNGGAHTNANVLTHWFYLLSEGGSGVNDNGTSYQVSGIGIKKAASIAYRNLTTYLTPTSQFTDARAGMIWSAEDLFGKCSPEAIAAIQAWYAVGVGDTIQNEDLRVIAIQDNYDCQPGDAEPVTVTIMNLGCTDIPAGDLQMVYFITDPPATIVENINLPNGLEGYGMMEVTFSTTADFSAPGDYELKARTLYLPDPDKTNDLSDPIIIHSDVPVAERIFDFEGDLSTLEDSLTLYAGEQASVTISAEAGNGGGKGILMEGGWGFDYRFVEAFPLWGGPAVDLFSYNPDFFSSACFCVDGAAMSTLNLSFDLKQQYSNFFAQKFLSEFGGKKDSMMRLNANNLRITVSGNEIARYLPETTTSDTFRTHTLNLDAWLGQTFPLCFETKAVWNKADDINGVGDRVFLDNIRLEGIFTSVEDELEGRLIIFPNPVKDMVTIRLEHLPFGDYTLRLTDLHGRTLFATSTKSFQNTDYQIDMNQYSSGIYFIRLEGEGRQWVEKFIRQD